MNIKSGFGYSGRWGGGDDDGDSDGDGDGDREVALPLPLPLPVRRRLFLTTRVAGVRVCPSRPLPAVALAPLSMDTGVGDKSFILLNMKTKPSRLRHPSECAFFEYMRTACPSSRSVLCTKHFHPSGSKKRRSSFSILKSMGVISSLGRHTPVEPPSQICRALTTFLGNF